MRQGHLIQHLGNVCIVEFGINNSGSNRTFFIALEDAQQNTSGVLAAAADQVKAVAVELGGHNAGARTVLQAAGLPHAELAGDVLLAVLHVRIVIAKDVVAAAAIDLLGLLLGGGGVARLLPAGIIRRRQEVLLVENIGGGEDVDAVANCASLSSAVNHNIARNVHAKTLCFSSEYFGRRISNRFHIVTHCSVAKRSALHLNLSNCRCFQIIVDLFKGNLYR